MICAISHSSSLLSQVWKPHFLAPLTAFLMLHKGLMNEIYVASGSLTAGMRWMAKRRLCSPGH